MEAQRGCKESTLYEYLLRECRSGESVFSWLIVIIYGYIEIIHPMLICYVMQYVPVAGSYENADLHEQQEHSIHFVMY